MTIRNPTTTPRRSPASGNSWPTALPDDDFTTFRAACRDRLSKHEFAVVDDAFLTVIDDATAILIPVLRTMPPRAIPARSRRGTRGEDEFERAVAGWFARRWEDTESLQHYQVTVRAAQVAAFNAGYLIQIDLDRLIGMAETTPRRAQRNPATWARLRAYPQPHRAAACALAAAGMATDPMSRLRLDSCDPATGVVTDENGSEYVVEEHARMYLQAQQTLRELQGAQPHDLLLLNPSNSKAIAPRALSTYIRRTRRELGAAVGLAEPDTTAVDADRWMRRWGINILDLT